MAQRGGIHIGIGGWTYAPWRKLFYPAGLAQKDELSHAASVLTGIEINGTFYRSQRPETFAKWRDAVPEGFVFAVKGPRYATNRRVLAEAGESIERFTGGGVTELGDKLGPILWQFAETKRFDPDDFAAFLALLPDEVDGRQLRHAVEVRHESFCSADFVALARRRGVAVVRAVDSRHPEIADLTADFAYLRLMGTSKTPPLGYDDAVLDARAEDLIKLARGHPGAGAELLAEPPEPAPRDVFCFVISGHKVSNPAAAGALISRVDGALG